MSANIRDIQKQLEATGCRNYSELLEPYAEKTGNIRRVGVIVDHLSGKSTVINSLLERVIVPATAVHTECRILIAPAENDAVVLAGGRWGDISLAEDLCEELPELRIEATIPYLSENNIEFMEFPEALGKKFH